MYVDLGQGTAQRLDNPTAISRQVRSLVIDYIDNSNTITDLVKIKQKIARRLPKFAHVNAA